ncbi:hypothetical protein [Meiothermus taiwanensis]|uniref:hypothetical protein n=1 Tax=Meiothermus taiwanensis TaxID=172827 RepID=UPI0007B4AA0D|nr:hypothetical protein [Meiothermus taiwanensis]KZK16905.1 hypothetical protein A3962_13960 [Meiothermus taiwanensis]
MSFSTGNAYQITFDDNNLATSGPGTEPPLWKQILGGLGDVSSLLDPYIYTDQEKARYDLLKAQAEAEKARAQAEAEKARAQAEAEKARAAGIAVQPAVPAWVWVVGAAALVLVLVLMLRD